ncbi:MAG: ribonuclease domain-containing protein [Agathobaculum sp.]|jgi:ribonuclease T1|uniref:ribonuclease domain-containing protein n=1 Tax=Agathobaculum sp. TaxID=2048138 RepID=UPI003D905208
MKKITSLWLTLLLGLSALTGCAQNLSIIGGQDGPTEVIVSQIGGGQAAEETPSEQPPAAQDNPSAAEADEPTFGPAVTGRQTILLGDTVLDEEGWYTGKEEVALYLMQYGELPQNYITKKEAQALGWEGGSLEPYAPGRSIGGDHFGNYEGALPEGDYRECDIDAGPDERGAKRLVFSDDGLIFYTEDHYETFTLLTGAD